MPDRGVEDLLRTLAPQVLGAVVRRYGHFDLAEDAVQEALLAAATKWPPLPDNPKAWLVTVAARRLTDLLRNEQARREREDHVARWPVPEPGPDADDTLILLFLCCHPALSPASQIALTLRAVGGLTTQEIARAFLVPEATMARRISRAKQRMKGLPFAMPRDDRLGAVLHVLYLIFNEGYAATAGPRLQRVELSAEAIRLTRIVHHLMPEDAEVTGLLALMLLTDARRPARTGPAGELVPMAEQDRELWSKDLIAEGIALVEEALPRREPGPYQVQAAIAALHDEAPSAEDTDWPQIRALYEVLLRLDDNPVVSLNHAVAVAMVDGPEAGLGLLDDRLADDHRLHAVRAHLLELAGDPVAARASYVEAARRTASVPRQRYLRLRAARLDRG
ncbi:RNA polymerase sigma24 factor [Lentzea sp. NBRC 105346]|uniref:RNA polymerase sigma factor n=1 Tax=Lentzea sp. NBRC 105346 TaxID=3032205 RepID=UPI0024A03CB1|nr:sigma-70 family RNA polymerase sigma factor [Lentzea sp. NBRC 105346]GLZ35129.1 RNA polymerase sigma24 factor [Lentzea sp. NBRC 105346]